MLDMVYVYQDHDKRWYLSLVYAYDDDKGRHKVIFPKVNLPVDQCSLPNIVIEKTDYVPGFRNRTDLKIATNGDFELFKAPTEDPRNGEKLEGGVYYDILVEPKVHKMTLKEVEEKLGYKVEIVSGE